VVTLKTVLHVIRSRKWWLMHVLTVAAVLVQLRLGLWQWHRANSPTGGIQNYAYAFQWPLFAVFTVVLWWKTLREEVRKDAGDPAVLQPRRPMPDEAPPIEEFGGVRMGIITQMPAPDLEDDEVTAYNAYLARLNRRTANG
jgi:hypothetical protein